MKYEVRESTIAGRGSFATDFIARGEVIASLTGEVVDEAEIDKRIESGEEASTNEPLQIGRDKYLDLDERSRLFNHSCDPNAGIRGTSELFATRDIIGGEEITFDYSATVTSDEDWWMVCRCGSTTCRYRVGNILSLPRETLNKYRARNALQDYIIAELKLMNL